MTSQALFRKLTVSFRPIRKEIASSMYNNHYYKVLYFMKALQAQHTQNLMNANTIVPGNAKKVYICTAGLSTFNEYSNSINFHHKGPKRRWKKSSNYNTHKRVKAEEGTWLQVRLGCYLSSYNSYTEYFTFFLLSSSLLIG